MQEAPRPFWQVGSHLHAQRTCITCERVCDPSNKRKKAKKKKERKIYIVIVAILPNVNAHLQGEDGSAVSTITRHSKGCSCRKSNCLKKYCECFQAGIYCALTCRCKECRNFEGSSELLAIMHSNEIGAALYRSPVPSVCPLLPLPKLDRTIHFRI